MADDETPRNKGGRPAGSTTGQAKLRTLRMGPLWERGQALAKAEGIHMTALVEEALRREIARRDRRPAEYR
jgi:hypothetical protein